QDQSQNNAGKGKSSGQKRAVRRKYLDKKRWGITSVSPYHINSWTPASTRNPALFDNLGKKTGNIIDVEVSIL
ncbi:MAG: hypothetical protein JSW47_19130, partial [Phycisphaerales bacterium]